MVGRKTLIAVVALMSVHVAFSTWAQDENSPAEQRLPTLGERLQRLRKEVLGDGSDMPRRVPSSTRALQKKVPQPQPTVAMPIEADAPADASEIRTLPSPAVKPSPLVSPSANPSASSSVTVPSYLETQAARPARPGASRHRAPVDPATQSLRANMAPVYRPAEEARRRAAAPETESDETLEVTPTPEETPTPEVTQDGDVPPESPLEQDESPAEELPAEQDDPQADLSEDAEQTDNLDLEPEPAQLDTPDISSELGEPIRDGRGESSEDGAPTDSSGASDSSDVLFTSKSPVLSVEAAGPRTVMIGKEADFVVRVRNAGAAANDVVVSINIPSNADVAGAKPTAGNAQPAAAGDRHEALEWTIDRLEADSEETLALKLVPRQSSPLDLSINWTFRPETSQTMVEVQEPKLAMTLTGPNEVHFGDTKIYTLTISNPGNGDTDNVSVGLLPIGRSGEATGSHKLGVLKAGESKTIDIELTARQAGAITIKAHAFADGGLRAEAAQQVLVRRASLQVEVEAPRIKYAGTGGTFNLRVANVGNAAAENVKVSAILPPDAKFISASSGGRLEEQQAQVNWTVGSLPPGSQRVFELQCSLNAPGDNRMQFAAAAAGDLSAAATSNTRVEAIADLKLEVRDPQGPVAVGDEAVYEVRVRNRGTKAAEEIDLVVFFSEGLEAISADGGAHDIGAGQIVFRPIATLAAGDTAVFHIRARAEQDGNHVFRAEVTCEPLDMKLATEEATHFYGDARRAAVDRAAEPHLAAPPDKTEADKLPPDEPLSEEPPADEPLSDEAPNDDAPDDEQPSG